MTSNFEDEVLKWNHVEGIFSCLVTYLRTSTFTDLVLHTEDTSNPLRAHSIILAALSPNLKSVLKTVSGTDDGHHIVIPGVTRPQLEKALCSIYSGTPDEASCQCLFRSGMMETKEQMLCLEQSNHAINGFNEGVDIKKEDDLEMGVIEPLVSMCENDDIPFEPNIMDGNQSDNIDDDPSVYYLLKNKSHKCDVCSLTFTDNWKLQRHKDKPCKLKSDIVNDDKVEYRKVTKKIKKVKVIKKETSGKRIRIRKRDLERSWKKAPDCGCNLTFENKKGWSAHMKAQHPDSVMFSCLLCQGGKYTYSRPETLEKHMQSKHSHKCSKCEYSCGSKDILRRHERFKHPDSKNCIEFERDENEESFCCEICGKKVASATSLYSHRLVHLERTWPCSQCGKKFRTQEASALHEVEAHGDEVFLCTICARSCASKRKLREHTRLVHMPDSEKPYQCSICSKGFLGKNSLQSHMSSIHYKDTPHACRYGCGRAYNDGSNRNQHERKSHGGLHHSVVEKLIKNGNRTYDPILGKFINKRQNKYSLTDPVKSPDSD